MVSVTHYSCNVHGQPNTNAEDYKYRVNWKTPKLATSTNATSVPKGNVTSQYYVKTKKSDKSRPHVFTAHDFRFTVKDIPRCSYINKITFTVRMRVSGKVNVKAPYARFNLYNGRKTVKNNRKDDTGWEDNIFYYNPNKKLTNNWVDYKYVMTAADFYKASYPVERLHDIITGIDLKWYKATNSADSTVYIKWVSCTIDYETPHESISFSQMSTQNAPVYETAGKPYRITAIYKNNSKVGCCTAAKNIQVKLPPNATATAISGNYDSSTNIWTVQCVPNAKNTLTLQVEDYTVGEKLIGFNANFGDYRYWVFSGLPEVDEGKISVLPQTIQKGVISCIKYSATITSNDGTVTIPVNVDTGNNTHPDLEWSIDYSYTANDVTIDTEHTNNNQVTFNMPTGEGRTIIFNSCFIPSFVGDSAARAAIGTGTPVSANYTSIAAPQFIVKNNTKNDDNDRTVSEIQFNPEVIRVKPHRVATSTELGAYVIDCGIADFDIAMGLDDCTFTANTWEKVDYIGMIPLRYHHYDPKSTYENKAISQSYKNKTYKGKEGVIDEDISLQFKVRPPQATTLQGLVKLDKPTPINANHKCFEGDVLNHRGWVVLSKVEVERTNPLWYDVKATVDYITHDINTKFQIFKEKQSYTGKLPDVQADVFTLGTDFSEGLDIFDIDTDGGFVYDEDTHRNMFALDEGQHLSLNTKNTLSPVSNIRFDWYTGRNEELRENKISRIFRLRDKNGNSVFEYEYTDFQYETEYVTCTAIARVLTEDGGWSEPFEFTDIDLKTEIDVEPIDPDDDDNVEPIPDVDMEYYRYDEDLNEFVVVTDDDYDGDIYTYDATSATYTLVTDDETNDSAYEDGYIAPPINSQDYDINLVYGTSLLFELNGNKLIFTDTGYNEREAHEEFTLVDGEYSFETEWVNNNADGTTVDSISYIDINLSETVLNTEYATLYKDLTISPFPVPYKKLVFTRESEEGTIYYYNDQEPFKYLLEPYYQYHCGTDLITRDGISIFDLNNSYSYFYIENGLVRLGFNKYNGRLSLAKWDINSKEWVTTHYFQMTNDTKFSLASYSDDKIVIKAGTNTFFTIWRGHPYIHIKNPTDTINIDSTFNYVYGDNVDNYVTDYPMVHSFLNTDNLLPSCIGAKNVSEKCVIVDDDIVVITTDHEITLNIPTLTALADNTLGVTLTNPPTDGEVHYLVDGVEIGSAEYPFDYTTDAFREPKAYTVQAVYTGDDDNNIAISEEVVVTVKAADPKQGSKADDGSSGKYKLEIVSAPKVFTYRDNQAVVMRLTRGGVPKPNMVVEKQLPIPTTASTKTNAKGEVSIVNNSTDFVPAKYKWGGRFYDNWDNDQDKKLLYYDFRWIEIKKATPTFTVTNAPNNIANKGKKVKIKLNGVDSKADPSKKGLAGKKVAYSIDGGMVMNAVTNEYGKFGVTLNTKNTHKIKCVFAGSTRYNAIKKTFTIKVV